MTDPPDPVRPDANRPRLDNADALQNEAWSNATWGWIAGIAVAVLVLVLVFGRSNESLQTASGPGVGQSEMNSGPSAARPQLPAPGVPAPNASPSPPAQR